jgi:hypothetical protein
MGQPIGPNSITDPTPSSPKPAIEPRTGPIEKAPLDIHLKDENGALKAYHNWTAEEFDRAYKFMEGIRQQDRPPPYSLQSISVTGAAQAEYADLTIQVTALVRDEDWVKIPLGLDPFAARENLDYQGPGQSVLRREEGSEGYVWYVRGPQQQLHELTLKGSVPLLRVGDEVRLRLSTPRAVRSTIDLTVPLADAEAEISGRDLAVASSPAGKGATQLAVSGLDGQFEIVWHKADGRKIEPPPILEVVGSIRIAIDSHTVNTFAELSVESYRGSFDRFRVNLPPGAELAGHGASDYDVIVLPAEAEAPKGRPLVEVRFHQAISDTAVVELQTTQDRETIAMTELAGFEVPQAGSQRGHVDVTTEGDLEVSFGRLGRDIRRVSNTTETPGGFEGQTDSFEYTSQPYSLTARAMPATTRIRVDPEYLLMVRKDRVQLKAKFKYTVWGKEDELRVELPGWQLEDNDPVGPGNMVAVGSLVWDSTSGTLLVPLIEATTKNFEVTVNAWRPVAPDATSLVLPLPVPEAASHIPAKVAVWAADNIELIPDAEKTSGLTPRRVPLDMEVPPGQQDPLYFIEAEAAAGTEFVAGIRLHEKSVAVELLTKVDFSEEKGWVKQEFTYRVDYEPLRELTLEVPQRIAALEGLEIRLDGELLAATDVSPKVQSDAQPKSIEKRVVFPDERIGRFVLKIQYPIEGLKLEPQTSVYPVVPLIMPGEGELTASRLCVTGESGVHVDSHDEAWTLSEEPLGGYPPTETLEMTANRRTDSVELLVHLEDLGTLGSTVVERAWIQTRWTESYRQDRAVFQFTTDESRIELILPVDVVPSVASLLLDGQFVQAQPISENRLTIALAAGPDTQPHRLEATYHCINRQGGPGQLSLEFPRLGDEVWVRRMYWQLVLPRNQHVIVSPDGFVPEFRWAWNSAFWGRAAAMNEAQLEAWSGAVPREPVHDTEAAYTNSYLFSREGPAVLAELRTASRTKIVAVASLAALAAGLVLIYLPATRHPVTLLLVTVLLAGLLTLEPAPTLLLAQAASLGLALTLLAGFLHRSAARRHYWPRKREASSSIFDRGSTETEYLPSGEENEVSTETNSPLASNKAPGSES